jgi:hypothetical protein
MHGGRSTGPRTPGGIQRIKAANTKHGFYTKEAILERKRAREEMRMLRVLLKQL